MCVQMRYANNSQYKNDRMIRKECFVNPSVLDELKKIIEDCEVIFGFPLIHIHQMGWGKERGWGIWRWKCSRHCQEV